MSSDDEGVPDAGSLLSLEDIEFESQIGIGSFGSVFKGNFLGTTVAVKKIKQSCELEEDLRIYVEREKAMTKFSHPHLVQFIGVAEDDLHVYLVTEFMTGGDLRKYLKSGVELPWSLRTQAMLDCAKSMAFLHSKGIMHRDLKSKNLLVGEGWKVKLCDFGFARCFQRGLKRSYSICGTEDWMAPECLLGEDYDEKVDSFSFGVVLAEVITRKKVPVYFVRSESEDFRFDLQDFREMAPADCPPFLLELAARCLSEDSALRPPFVEIIKELSAGLRDLPPTRDFPTLSLRAGSGLLCLNSSESTPPPASAARAAAGAGAANAAAPPPKLVSVHPPVQTPVGATPKYVAPEPKGLRRITPLQARLERQREREARAGGAKPSISAVSAHFDALHSLGFSVGREEFAQRFAERFASSQVEMAWVLLGYAGKKDLKFLGDGVAIEDLRERLQESDFNYVLLRIPIRDPKIENSYKTRDVFVQWKGPETKVLDRGIKKTHVGEVKELMQPFHAELTAVHRENFLIETIIAKSDPLSGSHEI